MRIVFASDHAGFSLKERLKEFVRDELGHEISDQGPFVYNQNDDYPDYVALAARAVAAEPATTKGIVIGGSGQGEAIAANRFKGVRAVVYYTTHVDILRLSREHNDANILSIGARFIEEKDVKKAIKAWLATPFSGEERHARRIQKLDSLTP